MTDRPTDRGGVAHIIRRLCLVDICQCREAGPSLHYMRLTRELRVSAEGGVETNKPAAVTEQLLYA